MEAFKKILKTSNYINNQWVEGNSGESLKILDKYSQEEIAEIALASEEQMEEAIVASESALKELKGWSGGKKASVIKKLVHRLARKKEAFAHLIAAEAGKPLFYAMAEVERCVSTLSATGDEAVRFTGEVVPVDYGAGEGKTALTKRFPVGPVAAISPFNFPLNLAMHKIAPALACGCPVILKPSPQSPLTSLAFMGLFKDSDFPAGTLQMVNCDVPVAEKLVTDERIKFLSFTGSDAVGWHLKKICGKKKVALELGGNAAVIVDETVDLKAAAKQVATGAFLYAGQICISTQRIYAVESVFEEFKNLLIEETKNIKTGNPLEEGVVCSSVIDAGHLNRINSWVQEAVQGGAKVLVGGKILDTAHNLFAPTLLTNTNGQMKVVEEEIFGPVAVLEKVEDFNEALKTVNNSKYGLQAGVYTNRVDRMKLAHDELDVGGVIINSIPGFRVDTMPYGGVKDSGLGREGLRYAMEEMTEPRLLVY